MKTHKIFSAGFSLVEVILAGALFVIFATATTSLVIQGYQTNRLGSEETVATEFASEGIEAMHSIKNQNFSQLVNSGGTGLVRNGSGVWTMSGANNTLVHNAGDNYTRVLTVGDVRRDANGHIVATGGTIDPDTKKIVSTVSWNFNSARQNSVSLTTYLSNWRRPIVPARNGFLAYGNGGTTSDSIAYKVFNGTTDVWGSVQTLDVDTTTNNKAVRALKVYSSATRNEKIIVSRHVAGTNQFIYASVFNGATFATSLQLATWASVQFLDVRNFDGGYLNDGRFVVVYSDNTTTPKYRIWNGTSWTAEAQTTNVGGIPTYLVFRTRPGANEAVLAVFDQSSDTNTTFFNGTTWSSAIEHSAVAPTNTKEHITFVWSAQNATKGALILPNANNDTTQNIRVCTAPCTTIAGWSASVDGANLGGRLGPVDITSRIGAEEFLSCQKNANGKIGCLRANTTPAWSTPVNDTIANNSPGDQRSYKIAFEEASGIQAIIVYSNNSAIPQMKVYDRTTDTFTVQSGLNSLGGILATVRMQPYPAGDDIMVLMADANNDVFSVMWNGTANAVYTTPAGRAQMLHGTNGSATTDFWYDFVWDRH